MIAILIYWLIGFFIIINLGKLVDRILKIKNNLLFYSFINGLFLFLIFFSLAALSGGVYGFWMHFAFSIIIFYSVWKNMEFTYINISQWIKDKMQIRFLLLIFLFLFLLLSAQFPYLHRNEVYYIQTIKWAGEYGLVKGLINLHPFLSQFSTWHILQAAFNPGYFVFNDVNGLLLLIYLFYLINKTEKIKNKKYLVFEDRLILLYLILFPGLMFFINAPSPNLPMIISLQTAFYLYIRNFYHLKRNELIQLIIFVLFAIAVKSHLFPLLFLPLIILIKYRKKVKLQAFLFYGLSVVLLLGYLFYKNYIVTGYPFYPFVFMGEQLNADWRYPREILDRHINIRKVSIYGTKISTSYIIFFIQWLFDKQFMIFLIKFLWVISLLLMPLLIRKHSHKKALIPLYGFALLYFLILFFQVSYLRELPYFEMIFFVLIWERLLNRLPIISIIRASFISIIFFGLFLFIYYPKQKDMFYNPMLISRYKDYDAKLENLFILNYPLGKQLFWETGDAFLPAAQPKMLDSLLKHNGEKYNLMQREGNLQSGFKLEKEN